VTDPGYRCVLTGKTAILFHRDDVEAADERKLWQTDPENQGASVKGDDRSPPWTWQSYLHSDGEHVAIPQDVIMKMLAEAGKKVPTGKGPGTFKSLSQSGIFPDSEFFTFTTGGRQIRMADIEAMKDEPFSVQAQMVRKLGFQLFVKPCRPGASRHIRVRPRFNAWQVEGVVTVTEPTITDTILTRLFEIGGKYCGLLDWRPNSKKAPGPYGTFTVEVEPMDAPKKRKAG
jgi:hypothetical protein